MTNIEALLTSESNEYYTPSYIVEPGRKIFGKFDLDPFSCKLANSIIKAEKYYTLPDEDGFNLKWFGKVFVNPPGGKIGKESSQNIAWQKLISEFKSGNIEEGLFICFNLGFLQVSQQSENNKILPLHFPICYPKSRIAYLCDHLPKDKKPSKKQIKDFEETGLCEKTAPPGASCIVLVTENSNHISSFYKEYHENIGEVVIPF